MAQDKNRAQGQKGLNPQEEQSRYYESQLNRDESKTKNASDAANAQHSSENSRDSNAAASGTGSPADNNPKLRSGKNPDKDYNDTKDNMIPNPDDFDEGDYDDSIDDRELIPNINDARDTKDPEIRRKRIPNLNDIEDADDAAYRDSGDAKNHPG
jgi:hypothetical protein